MTKSDNKKVDCAVALSYALQTKAPIITASGRGAAAKKNKRGGRKTRN
ncbi:hypothetical protein [Treponema sp. OMZ 788]|nr:hypothetical protein [Treponema sp. OMZ 788]